MVLPCGSVICLRRGDLVSELPERALLPGMRRHGGGRILSVSSGDGELAYLHSALQDDLRAARTAPQLLRVLGRARPPRQRYGAAPAHGPPPAYALSKAALNAGSRILAAEEAGVWVGTVCPGDVRTRMCVDPEARARDHARTALAFPATAPRSSRRARARAEPSGTRRGRRGLKPTRGL